MVTRLARFLFFLTAFIPLHLSAQVPSTDIKDYQVARKRLYVSTDSSKYFTRISWTLDSSATHKHVPSARAVVDYLNTRQPLVYEVGLISPLPSQPVPAGSVALKTVDLNGNIEAYFSSGTAWKTGGEFPGIKNVDSLMLGPGEVKAVHLGQNGADEGEVMKWNGTAWSASEDLTGPPVDSVLAALLASGASFRVDTFHKPGNHTWIKPPWATSVFAVVIGSGGGGSSGGVQASGVAARGGSGGGSGGRSERLFAAGLIADTITISVAAGGTGGAAVSTNSTNGVSGGNPSGTSAFGIYLRAFNGGSGTATTGGAAGTGLTGSGAAGASSSSTGSGGSATATVFASGAGVSSPGISQLNTGTTGFAGNSGSTFFNIGNFSSCAGGTLGCTDDGGDALVNHMAYLSTGGGGGKSSPTANGGRGGDARYFGGGGAGGAGVRNGFSSGRGGRGGDGFVAVYSFSSGVQISDAAAPACNTAMEITGDGYDKALTLTDECGAVSVRIGDLLSNLNAGPGIDVSGTTWSGFTISSTGRSGSSSGTTSAGGELVITHGIGMTPAAVSASYKGNNPYLVTITAKTSSTFTAKVWDHTGAAVGSTSVTIDWVAQ